MLTFTSKNISQFVSLKTRDFTVYERRGLEKSAKHFFTKYGNTHDCSSQRRGLALQHMVLCLSFFLERFRYTLCTSDRTTLVVWVKTDIFQHRTQSDRVNLWVGSGSDGLSAGINLSFLCADG
jgi:hypothetical protein